MPELETTTFDLTLHVTAIGDAEEFKKLIAEYMTLDEGVFLSDYGPNAWGGYDGPMVAAIEVRDWYKVLGSWTAPPGAYDTDDDEEDDDEGDDDD